MQIIRDLTKYKTQIKTWYMEYFKESEIDADCIFAMLDFNLSYGMINENNEIVNCVFLVEHEVHATDKTYRTLNFTCLMTDTKHRNLGLAKELVDHLLEQYSEQYDCMYLQTENWDLYEHYDLSTNTSKVICQFIPGNYPTPMLIIWDQPDPHLMQEIESQPIGNCLGVKRSIAQIEATIKMYQADGCLYLANPGAYIWYTPAKEVVNMQYSQLSNLIWLMHHVQPTGNFLMYEDSELKQFHPIIVTDKKVIVTKNFTKSKSLLKNVKLNDFLV